jgi:2-oxoglutarate ferredoxin oxidoreductase subunit gamma
MQTGTDKETRIVIAGFGGQGVVLAGNLLAQACVEEGKNVSMMVAYGAEMRGGTANSTVVISQGTIYSPVVVRPNIAVVLNTPSLEKFEPSVTAGGLIVANQSMMNRAVKRSDLKVVTVAATEIAHSLGNVRVANSVILGALIAATSLLRLASLERAVETLMAQKKAALISLNLEALRAGFAACPS